MPTGTWVITRVQGGNSRSVLRNCVIEGTPTGYDFSSPQPGHLLGPPGTSTSLPVTFHFDYQGFGWTVTIDRLTPRPSGRWSNNAPDREVEIGTWEAGVGEEEEEGAEGEEGDAEGEHSAD